MSRFFSHQVNRIARAGDAGPGSLERRRREIALPPYRIIPASKVLDGLPTLALFLPDSLLSVF